LLPSIIIVYLILAKAHFVTAGAIDLKQSDFWLAFGQQGRVLGVQGQACCKHHGTSMSLAETLDNENCKMNGKSVFKPQAIHRLSKSRE
jgi:hypothetical protein